VENETIELTEEIYEVMYEEPVAILGIEIVSLVLILVCLVKLLISSRALSKLKEISGSAAIFRAVIASIVIAIATLIMESLEMGTELSLYAESVLGLLSAAVILYGVFGFKKVVEHLSKEG
jgi:hypothetical protein